MPSPPTAGRADPDAAARRAAGREASVAAGVRDLERWLDDLVRGGLAAGAARPGDWEEAAARLVDARAPGLARLIRAAGHEAWLGAAGHERLLARLGSLELLLAAYRRQDALEPGLRAELRTRLGWTQSQAELRAGEGVAGPWSVLGQRVEADEPLRSRRSWLRGPGGQLALVLEFAHGGAPFDPRLAAGAGLAGELAFFAGARRERAVLAEDARRVALTPVAEGQPSLASALDAVAAALGASPWSEPLPLALAAVTPLAVEGDWVVRDEAGDELPLRPYGADGWRLLALAAGRPLWLFGEWSEAGLRPLSAIADERFVALWGTP